MKAGRWGTGEVARPIWLMAMKFAWEGYLYERTLGVWKQILARAEPGAKRDLQFRQ